ncbi:hypothetical protein ACLOJK_007094 [Asimina triloba]
MAGRARPVLAAHHHGAARHPELGAFLQRGATNDKDNRRPEKKSGSGSGKNGNFDLGQLKNREEEDAGVTYGRCTSISRF